MRWVLPHGALGVATGAIAIGMGVTLRSTTITIIIRTTISTAMSAARDKVIGSTIRNTAAMLLTVIGELQVNTVAVARVALVAQDALVVLAGPVALGSPAVPVALVA